MIVLLSFFFPKVSALFGDAWNTFTFHPNVLLIIQRHTQYMSKRAMLRRCCAPVHRQPPHGKGYLLHTWWCLKSQTEWSHYAKPYCEFLLWSSAVKHKNSSSIAHHQWPATNENLQYNHKSLGLGSHRYGNSSELAETNNFSLH